MPERSTSRQYNQASLEVWFGHVMDDWESSFSAPVLRRGREIYRQGKITALELSAGEVIVNCAFERKDTCYAVIEWVDRCPAVRSSVEDTSVGEAVAVAGLYELEELIADEIPDLPQDLNDQRPEAEPAEAPASGPAEADTAEEEAGPARSLHLKIEGLATGLRMTAHWRDAGGALCAALDSSPAPVPAAERELLVRLTGRAREAGFAYRKENCDFMLKDAERIAAFFTVTRKRWEAQLGELELDFGAAQMAEGVQSVQVIGRVEAEGRGAMRVDWRMKLGQRWLDPEDAERLARSGRGLHVVRGIGLVRVGEEQSEALADWHVVRAGRSEAAQTWPRYMVFSLFGGRGAELDLEGEMASWRAALTEGAASAGKALELPDFLRDYQKLGVYWMANLRERGCHGLLADEMGLGKTLQVLTLLQHLPFEGKDSLIVCPASVVPVWESEVRRWYPELQTEVLRSGYDFSREGEQGATLWVASYTQLRRHKHLLDAISFGYAVLDEAQQIKNPDAKVTQACCAIQAECRLALTGTPIENRLLDLWTLFRFLMPGLLGNRRRFEDYANATSLELRRSFEKRLQQQIAPFMLRRRKEQVVHELPPKIEMDLICPISELQRQRYEGLLQAGREEMGDDLQTAMQSRAMHFFSLLTRLRQVCCDPGLLPGAASVDIRQSGKVQILLTRLQEALQGDRSRKVVVFSQFVQLLRRLKPEIKKSFPNLKLYELTGQTRDRSGPVEKFQNDPGPALILVSLKAGGTGITLHAADYVFLLDPWWNPAVENQAIDRVHRIGQERRVFVYRMITEGTVEQRIQQLKKEKRELFEKTLGHLGSAKDLSEHFDDLEDLARLLPGR
ncbi:MAG: DEAD/DEAH box helicase [Opitutales bacterium]